MRSRSPFNLIALYAGSVLLPLALHAAQPDQAAAPLEAVWKPLEIRYSYLGFTTAYNCDSYEEKVGRILAELGLPPQTKVRASGCPAINVPSKNFFVTITTATPVPPSEAPPKNAAQDELLKRLGRKDLLSSQPFPARWKTVEVTRGRKLDLAPGDCELMEGLREHVLPKLSVKIVSQSIQCTPHQLSIQPPELTVSVLVPADADAVSADPDAGRQRE